MSGEFRVDDYTGTDRQRLGAAYFFALAVAVILLVPAAVAQTPVGPNNGPFFDPSQPPYNATPDGNETTAGTDDTAAFQQAIDDARAAKGGIVFPSKAGYYTVRQLKLSESVYLRGLGGGFPNTTLVQPGGVNASMIVNDPARCIGTQYLHWSGVSDLRLVKQRNATDTAGSGVELTCRTGEGFYLKHLQVGGSGVGFPADGVSLNQGGAPNLMVEDLHLFDNGGYGIDLDRASGDTWTTVHLKGISGDINNLALIRIRRAGAAAESFWISDVKAEGNSSGQQTVIELDTLNGRPVFIENLSAKYFATPNADAAIVVKGQNARVDVTGVTTQGYTNLLRDTFVPGGRVIPVSDPHILGLTYNYGTALLQRFDGVQVVGGWKLIAPASRPSVTGSRSGNAALTDLLNDLAGLGVITNGTTP